MCAGYVSHAPGLPLLEHLPPGLPVSGGLEAALLTSLSPSQAALAQSMAGKAWGSRASGAPTLAGTPISGPLCLVTTSACSTDAGLCVVWERDSGSPGHAGWSPWIGAEGSPGGQAGHEQQVFSWVAHGGSLSRPAP